MIYANGYEVVREIEKQGSFVAAANSLGISAPAVSKQVKSLENRLGILLFNRTTRTVVPTEAGKQLIATLNSSHEEISNLLSQLMLQKEQPSGRLKINAPMAFGEKFLVEPITKYAQMYPEVFVDVEFNDKRVHLIEDEYDLIIRIGKLEDSNSIAKRVCDFSSYFCASPEFLLKYGTPSTPDDLRLMPAVIYKNTSSSFKYTASDGSQGSINVRPKIKANSMGMLLGSTLKGIGFARLPAFACEEYLNNGRLLRILHDYDSTPDVAIYAIYPDKKFLPMKVRKFIDLLTQSIGS